MITMTQRTNWLPCDMKTVQLVLLISTQVVPQATFGAVPTTSHHIHEVSRPTIIFTSSATAGFNKHDNGKQNSTQLRLDEMKVQTDAGNYERTSPSIGTTSTHGPIKSISKKQEINDPVLSTRDIENFFTQLSEKLASKRSTLTSTMKQMTTNLDTEKSSLMNATIRKVTSELAVEEMTSSPTIDVTITISSSKASANVSTVEDSRFTSSKTEDPTIPATTVAEELSSKSSTEESSSTSSTEETTPTSSTEETTVESHSTFSAETIANSSIWEMANSTEIKSSTKKEAITTDLSRSTTFSPKAKNKTTKKITTEPTELISKTYHTPPKKYSHPSSPSPTSTTPVSQEPSHPSSFGIPPDKTTYIPTSPSTTKSYGSSFSWPSASLSTFIAEMQNKSSDNHSTTPSKENELTPVAVTSSTTIAAEPRIDPMQETKGLSAGGVVGVIIAVLVSLTIMSGSAFALYRKKRTRAIDDAIHLMTARRGHNVRFYYDSTI